MPVRGSDKTGSAFVRREGRALLNHPDSRVLAETFGGDGKKYRACVNAVFGECYKTNDKRRRIPTGDD